MRIHIVMHESFEAPGVILDWAEQQKCQLTFSKLFLGDKFPDNVDGFDFLIVMGGPQSPATTMLECPYFDAQKEVDFIKKAIEKDKSLLGVCLGAQLIGEALGAPFSHSPNREIGVYDLTLTDSAKKDPVFSTFPKVFSVGHWHGDMPGLTLQSEILATSEGCPRQVVRYSPKIYGFQCHFEFTQKSIVGMIQKCANELEQYKDLPYVENAEKLKTHDFSEINTKLFTFLNYIKHGI